MVRNALFAAAIIYFALLLFVLQECQFLAPYREVLWHRYGTQVLMCSGILFLNIFAAVYTLSRKLAFKDTGRKLEHLEKQLRSGETISEELSDRIRRLGG